MLPIIVQHLPRGRERMGLRPVQMAGRLSLTLTEHPRLWRRVELHITNDLYERIGESAAGRDSYSHSVAHIASPDEVEWQRVRDIRLQALRDAPEAFGSTYEIEVARDESSWREWITGWSGTCAQALFIALDSDAWVGMSVGARWAEGPSIVHVYAMWVEPGRRAQGLGRQLLDAILGWGHEHGATEARLNVNEENPAAVSLYRRAGFTESGERQPLREGKPATVVTMRRAL